ncbi:isopeptide-forming domain-containing fimbrial protein [Auraticoccus monumenti]|uniref:Conserved repeat domain-containing protein n=1 Tax=Auraticoccus monumenti TaxID=675864 RepID=A0A1G7EB95_9ACTN|nr:isopeptide-forming domain-containing fimbrial protein [Auraticoccus monumenti]SDE61004.1 conserved repeat domain-containing protein [Auraticoccus monumenti]
MLPSLPRRARTLRQVLVLTVCTVLASTLGLVVLPARDTAEAAVRNPFNSVYQSNENGTIAIVGNAQMSCPTGGNECTAARNGTASTASLNSNNGHTMTFLDNDNVGATTNSTSSELTLPTGSTVLHARLVWSGRQTAGTNGAASSGNIGQVAFRTPGQTAYSTVTAPTDQVYAPAGLSTTDGGVYQAAVDVTAQVRAAGTGTYWVGNIRAATGGDRYAGWSLVVAYRNPALPLRNLTIFQGFADVTSTSTANSTVDIPVSGFRTPASGTVNASVGFVAWEGDQGSTGDALRFNGSTLSDAARPANNYFTSRITNLGSTVTTRNPSYLNNLGVDMGTSNASGLLSNNQTSTTLQATTTGDYYYPGIITTAIDLYSPRFPEITKSVVNLSGSSTAQAGDTLEYTVSFSNTGGDAAANAVVRDELPVGATFVPGSLAVTAGAGTGPKTDAAGDDQGEYDAAGRTVRVRLGTGATATTGGTIAPGATTTFRFRVTVDRAAAGTTLANTAQLDYRAVTLGQDYTFNGNTVTTPVGEIADLAITSTSTPPTQTAGRRVTYNLTVTNNGPNDAENTVVTDTLPAGVTFVSATPSTGTCGQSGSTVTCQLGTLAPGATVTIPVVVEVPPGASAGTLVNRASVTTSTGDDVPGNNSTTASTTLTRAADLAATVTGPASAAAGEEVTWTATLTNNGPSSAVTASLTDLLPDGATFVRASASDGGTCTNANNQVSCTFGELAPGATRTVTVVGRLDPGSPTGSVVNTATASSGTGDPVPANNTASATTTVTQRAELSLTKTPSATSITAGSRARFTVVVTNSGPSDANDVVLTDPAVAGFTATGANASQGTCALTGGDLRCELGRIGPGASATVQLVGDVSAARAAGPLANTAFVSTATPQGDTGDDSATGTAQVTVSADVFLTKTATPNPVVAGTELTYTLTVGNNGPSRATGVSITDVLPDGTTFQGAADCTVDGQEVTCPVGALDVGQTVTRTVVVDTDSTLPVGGIANDATVTATSPDPTAAYNDASFTSTTGASADLSLTKTTSPTPLVAGLPVTYTLRATNSGPSAASGVVVTDTAPPGVTFTAATASNGASCTVAADRVTCAVGSLDDDEVVTVEITGAVAPTALGASSNTASVSAETPTDPTASNNSSTSGTTVVTQADLGVVLSPPADPVAAGEVATYQLRITNAGPSVARNTIVTGQVPPGLIPVPGSSGGACEVIGETVRCALGTLAPGTDTTVQLQATVPSDIPAGEIPGSAFIGSSATDPNPANDQSTSLLEVVTSADVSLTKEVTPETLVAGATATYVLTLENDGPSDAVDLTLTDELSEGLVAESVSSTLGTCTVSGQTVSCEKDRLAAGASAVVTVQVRVDAAATGELSNSATLTSGTEDPQPGDTTASVTAPVVQSADLRMIKDVGSESVVAGGATTYTLTVVNAGPSDAVDLAITDALPEGVTVLPGLAGGSADCSASTPTSISCTLAALEAGTSNTISFNALVDSSLAEGSELANSATVTSPTPDQTPGSRTDGATTTVRTSADVSLVKGAVLSEPTAGEPQRYQLTVTNNGPSDATEVVVTDQLPEGTTLDTAGGAGECSADGRTVTCELGTMTPGEILTVILDVDLAPDLAGRTLTNSATVSTATSDPDPDDDTDDVTSVVGGRSDLGVSKTVSSGPVVAGGQVTYSLSVTNAGPSSTRDVRLVDTLPSGVAFVSATATGDGSCSPSGDTVVCTWPALAVGADPLTATVTVTVPSATAPGSTLVNTADATSANPDPTQGAATVESVVGASADLSADKSLLEAPVAGEDVRWQVTVTNGGPSDATDVTLVDTAPTGVTFTAAETPRGGCTVTGAEISCALGTLAAQDSFAVTLVGALAADFTGEELSNTVTVGSDVPDADPTDNSDTATSPVVAAADLRVSKTADPATATAGGALTYTVVATNVGPSTARGVKIIDTLPAGFSAASATLTDPALGGNCAIEGSEVTCTVPTLADGASATATITGTVTADLTAADLGNRVSVQADTEDPDRSNDTTTLSTTVTTSADLAVVQQAPPTVVAGAPISWDVRVTNNGPSDARGILVTEVTSDVVGSLAATINGQDCVVQGTTVSCPLGSLPTGGSVTLTVTGVVDPGTTATEVSATATVSGSTTDPVPANNSSTTTTTISTEADLRVTNTSATGTFTAGERAAWLVEVRNVGPSTARTVQLSDLLGPGLSGVTATVDGVPCVVTGTEVLCDLGDLAAQSSAVVTVSALLDQAYAGSAVTTTATATSPTADPVPADNTSPSTTAVVTSADLRVSKRLLGDAVAGAPITFEVLATNDGPSQATGVVLTDTLPGSVTPTSATLPGGVCTVDGQVATCTLDGPLADGATAVATVVGTLDAGSTGELTNRATVSADTTDPQPGSNTTAVTFDPDSDAELSVVNDGPDAVVAGEEVEWVVTVTNGGPSDATAVQLTDLLPAGLTGVSATFGNQTCDVTGDTVTCALGDLASGSSVQVTVRATLPASSTATTISSTATVTAATPDASSDDDTSVAESAVVTSADVSVSISADPTSFVAGRPGSYLLTVTNDGPSDAQLVSLRDVLPTGLVLTGDLDTTQGSCTAAGDQVDCALGTVPAGASVQVRLAVELVSSFTGTSLSTTATVSTATTDPAPGNDSTTLSSPVGRAADLTVTKTGPESVTAGEALGWTVTVRNDGPSSAEGVVVTDQLPTGVGPVSVLSSQGTCTQDDGAVRCEVGALAPDNEATITLSVVGGLPADYDTGTITNTATATSPTDDSIADDDSPDGRSDSVDTEVLARADVNVSKQAVGGTFTAGGEVSWTITVSNAGPSVARDVELTDVAPDGVTGLTLSGPAGVECDGLVCQLGDLAPGGDAAVQVTATGQLPADVTAESLANRAVLTTSTTDPNPGDNEVTSSTTVLRAAGVSVTKTTDDETVVAGGEISWTLTVANAGPSVARDVLLVDPLADGLTDVTVDAPDAVDCSTDDGVSCTVGTLDPGGSVDVTVTTTLDPGFTGTELTNTASVTSSTPDAEQDDNADSSTSTVTTEADLAVTKTGPDSGTPGETISWTLEVANEGPSTARAVQLTDAVPASVTGVQVESEGSDCTVTGNLVSCAVGDLAPGATPFAVTLVGTISPEATGTVDNTATATSTTPDGDVADNSDTQVTTLTGSADVSVTKTADPATLVAGQSATFTITVANDGPSTARQVVLTDAVDPALGLTGVSGPADACTTVEGLVSCALGDLPADGTPVVVDVTVDVPTDYAAATFSNTATVSSTTTDPVPADNSFTVAGPVATSADLSLVKTVDRGTLSPGEPATFTLTVDNAGPSVARAVTVTDPVDPALEVTAVTGADCSTSDTGVVTCDLGDVAPDAPPVVITIAVDVPPGYATDTFSNSATVTSPTPDPLTGDNTGTVSGPAAPLADLTVTNTPVSGAAVPGTEATWEVVVTNDGPALARGVTLQQLLPAGVTLVSATGDDVECDTGTGACTLGDLAPGATRTLTVVAAVDEDYQAPTVTSTVSVTSTTPDPVPTDNLAVSTLGAAASADLSLVKTVDPEVLSPGEPATFTLTVDNTGPSTARGVRVVDPVDPALDIIGTQVTGADVECSVSDAGVVACDLGDLAADADPVVITIDVDVPADYSTDTFSNSAVVSSTTADPDNDDNIGTVSGDAAPRADLSVTNTPVSGAAVPGSQVTWTVVVDNAGPAVARGVTLTDVVPAGVTLVSLSGTGVTCDVATGSCAIGDLAPDEIRTITVVAAVAADYAEPTVTSTASVAATTLDPDDTDNVATSTLAVVGSADLSLVKTVDPGTLSPGEPATFTLTVDNAGPSAARDVTVTDPIDPALTVTGVSGADCEVAQTVTCDLGDLAPDADPVVITIDVDVPADYAPTTFTNAATVSSATDDPDPTDDTGTVTGDAAAVADLSVTTTPLSELAVPGTEVRWELVVRNDGPALARGVTLSEVLPAGVTLVSLSGADASCDTATGVCTLGDLAPGASRTLTVVAAVPAGYDQPTVTSTATVAATTEDPDATDDVSVSALAVSPQADLAVDITPTGTEVVPGTDASWTVVVRNDGPSLARGVTVRDVVPTGATLVSLTGDGVTCDTATGLCTVGDLAPGETRTITVVAAVDPGYDAPTLTSTATVGATTADPDATDDVDTSTLPVRPLAGLSLVKTVDPTTLSPGEPATFTLTVANDGPSVARDVTVTDPVDPALTVSAVSGADCEIGQTGTVSCDLGDLAPDADPVVITIDVDVPPGYAADTFANNAVVSSPTEDPDTADNTGTVSGPAAPLADLSVTNTPVSGEATPGTEVTWTVVVRNDGPATARAVSLTKALPAGVVLVSVTGDDADCDLTTGTCTLGDLAPGQTLTLTMVAAIADDYDQPTVTSTASLASATTDPDTTDNVAPSTLGATGSADLSLVKIVDPGTLSPGEPATFTLTVDNAGPSVARDVRVLDPVDPALEVTAVDGADCEVGETGTVTCELGDLAPDADPVVITIEVDVPAGYAADTFANNAVVSSATPDPVPADNTGTVSGPAAARADLSVATTPVPDVAVPGGQVSWTVVVTNDGPALARGVTVQEALPAGVTLVSLTGDDVVCDTATGLCTVGDLAPGESRTLTVLAEVAAGYAEPTVTSTASVTSTTVDPDDTDNVSSSSLLVVGAADLSLVKTVDPEVLSPGEPATFTLTVDNDGPSVARDVTVSDAVDPALTVTGTDGADCEVSEGGVVTCDLGDLAP